ncbi:MAG: hypothetical protein BWX90_00764 [bacterium ADurb.Bin132]|nr:MAG: hypothetical protein BWX90_00764 [bacterium ADurb.Bin132]
MYTLGIFTKPVKFVVTILGVLKAFYCYPCIAITINKVKLDTRNHSFSWLWSFLVALHFIKKRFVCKLIAHRNTKLDGYLIAFSIIIDVVSCNFE